MIRRKSSRETDPSVSVAQGTRNPVSGGMARSGWESSMSRRSVVPDRGEPMMIGMAGEWIIRCSICLGSMRDRLTILITNIAFAFRSGTEIVVDQIARGLNRRGHRPIVFAPYIGGGLTAGLRLSGIAVVDRLNQVGCTPDIIHGQHNVTTVMALAAFPRTPALFSCHDFDAPKDRAPLLPRIRRYIAVDDCCRERLVRDGAPPDRIDVVYNAVDLDQYRPRGPLPSQPQRALILTKGTEHLATVRSAAARAGLALDELGSGAG